jgi:hypothetical protein
MNKAHRFIFLLTTCLTALIGAAVANPSATDKCAHPVLRIDIDGDSKSDCVQTMVVGAETLLKIQLSSSGNWALLTKYPHSDERVERLRLSSYKNPRLMAPRSGNAIRLIFPEKSSVLYYWDKQNRKMAEFWETD